MRSGKLSFAAVFRGFSPVLSVNELSNVYFHSRNIEVAEKKILLASGAGWVKQQSFNRSFLMLESKMSRI